MNEFELFYECKSFNHSMRFFYLKKKYAREIINRFQIKDCNRVCTLVECCIKLHKDHGEKKVDT